MVQEITKKLVENDKQRHEGYADAMEELRAMLSCPVCYAVRFLAATEPGLGYNAGWRLAMIEVKHYWRHECPDYYQLPDEAVRSVS
jgi:hypothetical protein